MKSMTGYGKATQTYDIKNINVEIKTLNSKQADINIKLPSIYRSKEIEINNLIKQKLERGKIDCFVSITIPAKDAKLDINEDLFKQYYKQLKVLTDSVNQSSDYLTEYLLNKDDINQKDEQDLLVQESQALLSAVSLAIDAVNNYREQEGKALKEDFVKRVNLISSYNTEIEPFETNRVPLIKEKLIKRLNELELSQIDNNRLEQELIYYLEKLDVSEERTRLNQHIKYFFETIEDNNSPQGKKLAFIVQEMGREINTLGSKSNDANMQKIVVKMKDELEKIKEQLANIL
ncbi:MAG: YicC family protein [Bacteroidales bacterium]|jgi:uncharacterized protein (TIGR00255 family)|nr:YicC family protein [Bacteroidales bacterium]